MPALFVTVVSWVEAGGSEGADANAVDVEKARPDGGAPSRAIWGVKPYRTTTPFPSMCVVLSKEEQ